MGVEPKIGGKPPKMDGDNNGSKPYFLMDDLGVPLFLETPKYFERRCICQGPSFFFRILCEILGVYQCITWGCRIGSSQTGRQRQCSSGLTHSSKRHFFLQLSQDFWVFEILKGLWERNVLKLCMYLAGPIMHLGSFRVGRLWTLSRVAYPDARNPMAPQPKSPGIRWSLTHLPLKQLARATPGNKYPQCVVHSPQWFRIFRVLKKKRTKELLNQGSFS